MIPEFILAPRSASCNARGTSPVLPLSPCSLSSGEVATGAASRIRNSYNVIFMQASSMLEMKRAKRIAFVD